jgi:hypothetical protein
MPRLMPGIVGLVAGALLAALGLRRLAPLAVGVADVPAGAPASRLRRRIGWALIGVAVVLSAALCVHILLNMTPRWDLATQRLLFLGVRPALFVASIVLAGIGCALFGRREPGERLPVDWLDLLWIGGAIAAFVSFTTPTLTDWRFALIGDEHSFLATAYGLGVGEPFDMFWQAGVYSVHPLMSSYIAGLAMRAFGFDIFGWKMGLVVMGAAAIPPTYLLARWLFGRTAAQVAAVVVATSHYLFAYSHAGHNNIDALLPVMLTACLTTAALMRPSPGLWFAAGAAAGGSLYVFFAARVAGLMIATGLSNRGRRRFLDGLGPGLLGTLIVAAPFLARNQLETFTKMLGESGAVKGLPPHEFVLEVLRLSALSALAFHWSYAHGLYLSLGFLDPVSAALSALGVGMAIVGLRDWRRRLLVVWYGLMLLIAGGLSRHEGISLPRQLIAVPILGIFAGDAVRGLLQAVLRGWTPRRRIAAAVVVFGLGAVLALLNLQRFRDVTPARNGQLSGALAQRALYSDECRGAGRLPILLWGSRAGSMLGIIQSLDPNRYEPLMISDVEFRAVPAYRRWPCIVTINESVEITNQVLAEARRDPSARIVTFGEMGVGQRVAHAIIRRPALEDLGPMPPRGRVLYAVHYTNQRRGAGPGALHDQTDLVVDRAGRRYAADAYTNRVAEWDQDGYLVGAWGDGSVLDRPIAVAADERGLVVVDLKAPAGRVVLFGPDRAVRATYSAAELGLRAPRQVAINANGEVVIDDEALPTPRVFDRELKPLRALADAQRPLAVTDVGTAADGSVYVYSAATPEGWVRRYAADGSLAGEWPTAVRGGHLAVAPDGSFWLSMAGPGGVVRFDAAGRRLADFPAQAMLGGTGEGGIIALAVDGAGVHVLWRYAGVVSYRVAE